MPSIFHHLKIPDEKPTALVKMRQVFEWLSEVAKTEIVIKGKRQTLGESGVFGDLSGELTSGRPWEISRGQFGWIVGRGAIDSNPFFLESRVPRINGNPIGPDNENDPPLENPPELPYREIDGIIAIEAKFEIVHPESDGPYGGADPQPPFLPTVAAGGWTAWPEIKWLDQINVTPPITAPNGDESTSFTIGVPLARIVGTTHYPLRSTNARIFATINSAVAVR